MAGGINPFQLQMQQLQRRQAIADMMTQQSQQPLDTQMVGNVAVRRSPFEGLAKVAQAAIGGKLQDANDTKYQDIANAWTKAQTDSIGDQPQPAASPAASPLPPMPPQSAAPDAAASMPPESIRAPGFVPPMPPQQAPAPAGAPPQGAAAAPQSAPVQTFADALRHAQQMSNLGVGDEVVKAYLSEHAATPEMKQVAALYGQDTPQYRAALERIVNPAVATQPNAPLARFNPTTGKYETAYAAPNMEKGINPIVQNGQITGVESLPGSADVASTMAEAAARGKSMGDITNVTTGSGRVVPMLGRNALGQPPPLGGIGRGPQQAPQASPPSAPAGPGAAPGAQPNDKIWADMPKMPAPGGIGQTTADKQYGEELGKRRNELATQLGQEASTAQVMNRYIDRAQSSLPNASVGPFSNYLNGAKSALVQLGIPETFFSNMPSEGQKLNKDFVNMAASAIKSMPAFQNSPVRQAEFLLLMKEANPSTTMARRAVTDLLGYAKEDAAQLIQKNNLYTQFNQRGGDPNSFEDWYQKHFPTGGVPKPGPGAGKTLVYDPASGTFK